MNLRKKCKNQLLVHKGKFEVVFNWTSRHDGVLEVVEQLHVFLTLALDGGQ
jgi:hypothetical protein